MPNYLRPFVVPHVPMSPRREGSLDLYLPDPAPPAPRPVVVLVHGGPVPADLRPTPRDWPVFRGYGAWRHRRA